MSDLSSRFPDYANKPVIEHGGLKGYVVGVSCQTNNYGDGESMTWNGVTVLLVGNDQYLVLDGTGTFQASERHDSASAKITTEIDGQELTVLDSSYRPKYRRSSKDFSHLEELQRHLAERLGIVVEPDDLAAFLQAIAGKHL